MMEEDALKDSFRLIANPQWDTDSAKDWIFSNNLQCTALVATRSIFTATQGGKYK